MYAAYEEQKQLIPAGHLIEVKFEDFEKHAFDLTQEIYQQLSLPGFDEAKAAIQAYLDKKKGYKKNQYKYEPTTVKMVEENWRMALEAWGYDLQE